MSHEAAATGSGFHDSVSPIAHRAHGACHPRQSLQIMRRMMDYVENGVQGLMAGV